MKAVHDTIAVVDNGGQFTHLIATKVRNAVHVKSIIVDPESDPSALENVKGIILSGSPASVYDEERPGFDPAFLDVGVPVLGLCYGLHLMAERYGGEVARGKVREYGHAVLQVAESSRGGRNGGVFLGLGAEERVWMSHGDSVARLPPGFIAIGSTRDCPFAAIRNEKGDRIGLQFHPEVDHTVHGVDILRNFVVGVCGARPDWTVGSYLDEKVAEIKSAVGMRPVFLLASGGVDSTVCAALLARALPPEQVRAVHIDNGLMRKGESAAVHDDLARMGVNVRVVDASAEFLGALAGVADPERKRNIIGRTFIDVSDRVAREMGLDDWLLAQGTIYPDTIESGSTKHADIIKTHHNRVPIIQEMMKQGRIVEPLCELYKAEVRDLGRLLGLPEERIMRHPFPGPGLGIRLLCSSVDEDSPDAPTLWEGVGRETGPPQTGRAGASAKGSPRGCAGEESGPPQAGRTGASAKGTPRGCAGEESGPPQTGRAGALTKRAAGGSAGGLTRACLDIVGIAGMNGIVLPIKSVGVMGDARSFEHPLLVWWREPRRGPLDGSDWDRLWELATWVTNRVKGVNRVVLLLHPARPPDEGVGGLALQKAYVERERLEVLREADALVMGLLEHNGVMREIWQCPTVLLPIAIEGRPLAVIRPIYSERAMTARAAPLPTGMIVKLAQRCSSIGLGGWGVDLTHKPPGTIEWE